MCQGLSIALYQRPPGWREQPSGLGNWVGVPFTQRCSEAPFAARKPEEAVVHGLLPSVLVFCCGRGRAWPGDVSHCGGWCCALMGCVGHAVSLHIAQVCQGHGPQMHAAQVQGLEQFGIVGAVGVKVGH